MNTEIKNQVKNMTNEQKSILWEITAANHEALRQDIIKNEGEISIYKQYPDLDKLAEVMFYLMTNGEDELILTKEWIEANAEN